MSAVHADDREKIEAFAAYVIPKIKEYLSVTVRANDFNAEECAHQAFSVVLDRIHKGNFDPDANVVAYLLISARNEYFTLLKRELREGSAVFHEMFYAEPPEQLEALIDEDRMRVLQECLQTLDKRSRDLIEYMFKRPEASYLKISKVFGISPINARTRKSRIISKLSECCKRKTES